MGRRRPLAFCCACITARASLAFTAPRQAPSVARRPFHALSDQQRPVTLHRAADQRSEPFHQSGQCKQSLRLQQIDIPRQNRPHDYVKYVEDLYCSRNSRVVRWHISEVDEALGIAKAEVVVLEGPGVGVRTATAVWSSDEQHTVNPQDASSLGQPSSSADNSPSQEPSCTASPPRANAGSHGHTRAEALRLMSVAPLMLLGVGLEDLGQVIRSKVRETNDALIIGSRQLNEQQYRVQMQLEGKGEFLERKKARENPLEMEFAQKAVSIPEFVFLNYADTTPDQYRTRLEAVKAKYRPFFERGFGGKAAVTEDVTNPVYYNYLTYCQWKVFREKLNTRKQQAEFLSEIGRQALKYVEPQLRLQFYNARKGGLGGVLDGCVQILKLFQAKGFIVGFALVSESIDETSFIDGAPSQFNIVVDQEAALRGKMLLDYEGNKFFLPNLLPACLASYMQRCNIDPHYEQYYLDDRYHPNPEDYNPSQTLIQWTLEEEGGP